MKGHGFSFIFIHFNTAVENTQAWRDLKNKGWFDAGQLSSIINNHQLEPTCHDATRYSFVLCSPILRGAFRECRTQKHYHFAAHPCYGQSLTSQRFFSQRCNGAFLEASISIFATSSWQIKEHKKDLGRAKIRSREPLLFKIQRRSQQHGRLSQKTSLLIQQ